MPRISDARRDALIERFKPPAHPCDCDACDEHKGLLDLRDAREALTIAVEALEFYKDKNNYVFVAHDGPCSPICSEIDPVDGRHVEKVISDQGNKARTALDRIKQIG